MDSLVDVVFVDYGNVQTTPRCWVKQINKKDLNLPPQAFKCSLDVVDDGTWTPEYIYRFKSMTMEKRFWALFTHRRNNPNYTVVLDKFHLDGLTDPRNKRPYQQVTENRRVFYKSKCSTFVFFQAFGEASYTTASPNLAGYGSFPPGIPLSRIKTEPGVNPSAFPSPIVAPYGTMVPPRSFPIFSNTPTGQLFDTPVTNSSPYLYHTPPNRFSSVRRKTPSWQSNNPVKNVLSGAMACPSSSIADNEVITISDSDSDEPVPNAVESNASTSSPKAPVETVPPPQINHSAVPVAIEGSDCLSSI